MELDELNLQILKEISAGTGLIIDYTQLSEKLGRHRSTIKRRIDDLLEYKIITPPLFLPFGLIFNEFPLFVLVFADLPDWTEEWLLNDPNVFAAFRIIEGNYNILIFEYHKTVLSYQIWRENLVKQNKIPSREHRHASMSYYCSNELIVKYEPNAALGHFQEEFQKNKKLIMNNYEIDNIDFNILKYLLTDSNIIKINKNILSEKLGVHRKTIELRMEKLKDLKILNYPSCYFNNFFAPPNYFLILSFIEIVTQKEQIMEDYKKDNYIPIIFDISAGKYNGLMISSHPSIDDFFNWNLGYRRKYNSIRSQRIVYLSPNSKIFFNQKKIIDAIIDQKLGLSNQ